MLFCYNFKLQCEAADKKFRSELANQAGNNKVKVVPIDSQQYFNNIISNRTDASDFIQSADSTEKNYYLNVNDSYDGIIVEETEDFCAEANDHVQEKTDSENEAPESINVETEKNSRQSFHSITENAAANGSVLPSTTVKNNESATTAIESIEKIKFLSDNRPATQCSFCPRWLFGEYSIRIHMKTHASDEQHKCQKCDKVFTLGANLKRHIRSVHNNEKIACEFCGVTYTTQFALKEHCAVAHTDNADRFQCPYCDKLIKTQYQWKRHIRHNHTHKKPRPPIQPRATKRLGAKIETTEKLLRNRKRQPRKTLKRIFNCKSCSTQFETRSACADHLQSVHNILRPKKVYQRSDKVHSCSYCDKTFISSSSLKFHIYTHTGEKPYTCTTCGASFRQRSHLNTHRLLHTGEKPHVCETCNKTFRSYGNFKVHLRLHTGEKPYECQVCGQKFRDIHGIKRHLRKDHSS